MSRRKRGPRTRRVPIRSIRISDGRSMEHFAKGRPGFDQLNHSHTLDLLGAPSIYRRLQSAGNLFRDEKDKEHADQAGAALESAKGDQDDRNQNKKWFPD